MTRLSRRTLTAIGVVTGALAITVILTGGLVGVDRLWPVLLGAAIGLAPGMAVGRIAALVLGMTAGWVGVWLRLSVLPDTVAGRAVAGAAVLAVIVAVAVASRDRLPLWAALAGAAGFLALAESTIGVGPAAFPVDHLGTLGSLLLGAGAGALAAVGARALLLVALPPSPLLRYLAAGRRARASGEARGDVADEVPGPGGGR